MTRQMYDAIGANASSIPAGAPMVAGYDTDHTPSQDILWTPTMWAGFPNSVHVHICGDGTNVGDVLDVESGAASVSQIAPWLQARRAATGVWKSLYYSLSVDGEVQAALANAGIDSTQVPKWIAWYNNHAALDDVSSVIGVVAKQYANPPLTGQPYDLSVVADQWPGIDSAEDITMDSNTAQGLARLVADAIFGRGIGQDTVGQISGDIITLGLAPAMDKWGAVAQQNGEISLTARLENLKQSPGATPGHDHASGGGGTVPTHTHSGGTTGPPQ